MINPWPTFAEYLDTVMPSGTQVYGFPSDSVKAPAVVILPEAAGAVPYAMGGPGAIAWATTIDVVVSRTRPAAAIDNIVALADQVIAAFAGAPFAVRWITFGDFTTSTIGGKEMLKASIETTLITKET